MPTAGTTCPVCLIADDNLAAAVAAVITPGMSQRAAYAAVFAAGLPIGRTAIRIHVTHLRDGVAYAGPPAEDLTETLGRRPAPVPLPKVAAPVGFAARALADLGAEGGTIVTGPMVEPINDRLWDEILTSMGLDPDCWTVVGPSIRVSAWDGWTRNEDGEPVPALLHSYRAQVAPRVVAAAEQLVDLTAILAEVRAWRPTKHQPTLVTRNASFVVCLSDWQLGKREGDAWSEDRGTSATVRRILASLDAVLVRVAELRAAGRRLNECHILLLGDPIENILGHYANQIATVDLGLRDQVGLAVRVTVEHVRRLAELFPKITVVAVPCNHGEVRGANSGKAISTPGDNLGLMVADLSAQVCQASPALAGVTWLIPRAEQVVVVDVAGVIVAAQHGHHVKGVTLEAVHKWWAGQTYGGLQAGLATLLLMGHLHHLVVGEEGPRTVVLCPTQDGGSDWLEHTSGKGRGRTGTLTMVVGVDESPQGWRDLQVV